MILRNSTRFFVCFIITIFVWIIFIIFIQGSIHKKHIKNHLINTETQSNFNLTTSPNLHPALNETQSIPRPIWLLVVIPTVKRRVNYLHDTIRSYLTQFPTDADNPFYNQIKIHIFNNNKNDIPHEHFEELKQWKSHYLAFHNLKLKKYPISKKHQQTEDIISIIDFLISTQQQQPFKYILFGEDDFTLCPNGFHALYYVLEKVNRWYQNRWIAIRVSYGLNGIIMHRDDLEKLSDYLKQHKRDAPVDHLFYRFCRLQEFKHNRTLVAYRNNLFYHIGEVSTLGVGKGRYIPACHQILWDWLQDMERFRNEDCPQEDLSPCIGKGENQFLIDFDMNTKKMCRLHFPLCTPDVKTEAEAIENYCMLRK